MDVADPGAFRDRSHGYRAIDADPEYTRRSEPERTLERAAGSQPVESVDGDEVPRALRRWFIVHGVVDWVFAIPLFFFPEAFLRMLGWVVVDPMAARGVAAAPVGIGTQSLLSRGASIAVYREMLSLKMSPRCPVTGPKH